jgi:hypothetical protein
MVLFRPAWAHLRIPGINDQDAESLFRTLQVTALGVVVMPFLARQFLELQQDPEVVSAARLVHGLLVWLLLEWCFISARAPLTRWFASNTASTGKSPVGTLLVRHWIVLSQGFLILLVGAQVYSAVTIDPTAGRTIYETLVFGLLLILLETLLAFAMRRAKARTEQLLTLPLKRAMIVRSVRVAAIVLAAMVVCQSWAVDVLGFVDEAAWQSSVQAATRSGITLFLAYVAYEMIEYYAAKFRMEVSPSIDTVSGAGSLTYSRVSTLVPVLRIVALVFVIGVPIFVVLTEAGISGHQCGAASGRCFHLRPRRIMRQPDTRQGHHVRYLLPCRRRLPHWREHRMPGRPRYGGGLHHPFPSHAKPEREPARHPLR